MRVLHFQMGRIPAVFVLFLLTSFIVLLPPSSSQQRENFQTGGHLLQALEQAGIQISPLALKLCSTTPLRGNFNAASKLPGQCVPIAECPEIVELLRGSGKNSVFLRTSLCGFVDSKPYVCCPIESASRQPKTSDSQVQQSDKLMKDAMTAMEPPAEIRENLKLFPQAEDGECGFFVIPPSDRIGGGEIANRGEWPWTVLLFARLRDGKVNHFCGGSLINSRYVLTAANCVGDPESIVYVRLGEFDTRTDPDCDTSGGPAACGEPVFNAQIEEIIRHPQYAESPTTINDIALIRLQEEVDFTKVNALPVCLPFDHNNIDLADRGKGVVTGWGRFDMSPRNRIAMRSDIMQLLVVPLVPLSQCEAFPVFRKAGIVFGKEHLCAGGEGGKDSCNGDSGGPLVKAGQDGAYYQIGIVSFGTIVCGSSGTPGVYARIETYLDWIRSVVKP